MALDPLKDLPAKYDPKGGSPRTPPRGIPASDYQEYVAAQPVNGSGFYKTVAGAFAGLWISSMLAWWTAFQGKGITRDELRNEMKEYKDSVAKIASETDGKVGELRGKQEQLRSDLNNIQYKQMTDERDFVEFKTETKQSNKLVADWMEAQKVKK